MITNAQIVGANVAPDRYCQETEERGSAKLTVRAHILCEVLRNAQRWQRGYQSPESKSKKFGSLLDCLLLTPTQYPKRYATTPATYTNKKGELSKWRNDMRIEEVAKWHEAHQGKEVLEPERLGAVQAAITRLKEATQIMDLLAQSEHAVMIQAQWEDLQTGLTVPLKALLDIVPNGEHPFFGNSLWDLKTTQNASPRNFSQDAMRYGYALQAAFYLDLFNAATTESRSEFGHIVIENYAPYEYRNPPPLLTQRFIGHGRALYQRALSIYCKALCSGVWPGYDAASTGWPLTDCADWYLAAETLYDELPEEPEEEEIPTESEVTP